MRAWLKIAAIVISFGFLVGSLSGCTLVLQKRHTSDIEEIQSLSSEIDRLKMTEEQYNKLKSAYDALQKSLKSEIADKTVTVDMEEKGLVITFLDSVLFNSGKAELKEDSLSTLDKVAKVCRGVVSDREVGVEGHTDNVAIKHSGWKSNWELSSARANSVVHYLIKKKVTPERLSATGYGEYRPRTTNKTEEGRQRNRRVEIVILPEKISKESKSSGTKYVK